jgi:hypothetical protein
MGVTLELAAGLCAKYDEFLEIQTIARPRREDGEICVTREFLLALPSLGALEALDVHSGVRGCPTPITSAKPAQGHLRKNTLIVPMIELEQ